MIKIVFSIYMFFFIPSILFAGSYKNSVITLAVNSEQGIADEKTSSDGKSGSIPSEKKDIRLSLEEQEKLAKELYGTMAKADKWETDTFIKLHNQVIDQCPDTKRAQESLWRLSNLYLLANDPPEYQKVIELMEKLISKYPDSTLVPDAKTRLRMSYEQTGNYKKAIALYEDLFAKNPDIAESDQYAALLLGYAKALAETGDTEKARAIYQKVIDLKDAEDWLKDIARDALSGTEKSGSGEKKQ
ncbi:MAG: tetratricopeptide repeat protein [Nitrospira sp.]|nr:tetratricopeptide repeat protein [Nitrospira sp.]